MTTLYANRFFMLLGGRAIALSRVVAYSLGLLAVQAVDAIAVARHHDVAWSLADATPFFLTTLFGAWTTAPLTHAVIFATLASSWHVAEGCRYGSAAQRRWQFALPGLGSLALALTVSRLPIIAGGDGYSLRALLVAALGLAAALGGTELLSRLVARARTPHSQLASVLILEALVGVIALAVHKSSSLMVRVPAALAFLAWSATLAYLALPRFSFGWRRIAVALTAIVVGAGIASLAIPSRRTFAELFRSSFFARSLTVLELLGTARAATHETEATGSVPTWCRTDQTSSTVPQQPNGPELRNLLFVTIDAARADHLELYGYRRQTMPFVASLEASSVVFENAFSATPATAGSVAALWTGLSEQVLRAVPRPVETLPGALARLGYRTMGSDLSERIGTSVGWFASIAPLSLTVPLGASADQLVNTSINFIRDHKKERFAIFLHFFEAHDEAVRATVPRKHSFARHSDYDDALSFIDGRIEHITRELAALGIAHNTVIVITADHGEFLGEHGRTAHGEALFEEVIRVPLILHVPGVMANRLADLASGYDIAETVYHAVTGHRWEQVSEGRDLLDHRTSARRQWVDVDNLMHRSAQRYSGMLGPRFKYLEVERTEAIELYDRWNDRNEQYNLADQELAEVEEQRRRLADRTRCRSALAHTLSLGGR